MSNPKYFIDNAKPLELEYVLRSLPHNNAAEKQQLIDKIEEKFSFKFQKRYFDSLNRLIDLGLLIKTKHKGVEKLKSTDQGKIIKDILNYDTSLYNEIIHFLHYSIYDISDSTKPYFWSYKRLCELLWDKETYNSDKELAGEISIYIQDHFNTSQTPFDGGTIQKFFTWLKVLHPPIFNEKKVEKRNINYPELFLLSLDLFYKINNLRYGDPMLITPESIAAICKPFFITPDQFDALINDSYRLWPFLRQRSAFQGLSLILDKEYSIESIIK